MYVKVNGMGARRRRGFGAATVVTDPTTGQQKVVMDTPITTETVLPSGQSVFQDASGNVIGTGSSQPSLTEWLNTNSTMVAIGAAAFVGLIFFAKAGR